MLAVFAQVIGAVVLEKVLVGKFSKTTLRAMHKRGELDVVYLK